MTFTSPSPADVTPATVVAPRPEYPRPDRDRSARWLTLNGTWSFEAEDAPATITVPYAWESAASGIHRTWLEHAVYRRTLTVPADWTHDRLVLCFGAVHHRSIVRIDGEIVGEHSGGYDSFEFDVTDAIGGRDAVELSVEVFAPADKREIPHGKQRSIPRDDYDGVSFTPTSGIWQSVWLEARARTFAASVQLRGDDLTGFQATVELAGDEVAGAVVTLEALESGDTVTVRTDSTGRASTRLEISEPHVWSPADPYLYRVRARTVSRTGTIDEVTVTSGLRRIETRDGMLLLNGKRLSLRGVLDQGYWPETGLTAPSRESLLADLDLAAELGYNLVRKHLKFEEPLWLHEADRRGMLVWAEPAGPSRYSPASAAAFTAQLPGMVERDANHPSIIIWGLYNEEWGLDWDIPSSPARTAATIEAYETLRMLDDSRPIVDNSGWSHVRTDLADWHYYEPDLTTWRDAVAALARGERTDFPVRLGPNFVVDKKLWAADDEPHPVVPVLNSEYGEGFTSLERAWHLRWETQELRRHAQFVGYVYTEFADVEHEMAGLLTTDRRRKDLGGLEPSDVNAETTFVIDLIPTEAGADIRPPQAPLAIDLHLSHHGSSAIRGTVLVQWLSPGRPLPSVPVACGETVVSHTVEVEPFVLSDTVRIEAPAHPAPGRLALYFIDDAGTTRARSFLDAAEVEPVNRRGARAGEFTNWVQPGFADV